MDVRGHFRMGKEAGVDLIREKVEVEAEVNSIPGIINRIEILVLHF